MKTLPTLQNLRFAACARDATMLKDFVEIAGDNFISALIKKMNLTRGEIFRGKVSARHNQPNIPTSKKGRETAPHS